MTPTILIIMGVSGSGKSTIGEALAKQLHWPFQEGDQLHPASNVEKMRNSIPLNDDDRLPWLYKIGSTIEAWHTQGQSAIVSCSCLKRCYRAILRFERRYVRFVYLKGTQTLIETRLKQRKHAYMPPTQMASQFAALEAPADDEPILTQSTAQSVEDICDAIRAHYTLR